MNANKLLNELVNIRKKVEEVPPKGYRDVSEFGKLWGLSYCQARCNLEVLVANKKINKICLRRYRGGSIRKVSYYGK